MKVVCSEPPLWLKTFPPQGSNSGPLGQQARAYPSELDLFVL